MTDLQDNWSLSSSASETESAAMPPSRQERQPRVVTTLLVGKLLCAGSTEHLCRVRNISETGMLIETHHALGFGRWVSVELRSGEQLKGSIIWTGTGRAGVEFVLPVDVDRILAEAKLAAASRPGATAGVARAPRFEVQSPGRISSYGRSIDVTLENVSQGGARIRLPRPPKTDLEVILMVPGLPPRRCTTRWAGEETAGLVFHDVIPYHELAAWLEHWDIAG